MNESAPVSFQGTRKDLEKMFNGKLPEPGDSIELFCYEVTENKQSDPPSINLLPPITIKAKWRVKK